VCRLQRGTKTSSRRTNDIEALLEQLRSLQIIEEASSEYEQTTPEEISTALAPAVIVNENRQAGMPKNMVLDPEWFDGD